MGLHFFFLLFCLALLSCRIILLSICLVTQSPYVIDGLNTCISLRTSGIIFYMFRLLLKPADNWLHLSWNSRNIVNQTIGHAIEYGKHNVSLYNRLKLSFIRHGNTDHWYLVWLKFGSFFVSESTLRQVWKINRGNIDSFCIVSYSIDVFMHFG